MKQDTGILENEKTERAAINVLVDAAWHFAYMALWNNWLLSGREKDKAKKAIRMHLATMQDAEQGYYHFCQRVLLAKDYVEQGSHRYIPLPSQWLDESNRNGFAGTEAWLAQMMDKRSALPLYRREWKALAEAVLEMASDPSEKNFWYWKIYFLERGEGRLWALFLGVVAEMEFEPHPRPLSTGWRGVPRAE